MLGGGNRRCNYNEIPSLPRPPMPLPRSRLFALCLASLLGACRPATAPGVSSPKPAPRADTSTPLIAAHYFGRQWSKNYLAGFRREYVAEDFRQLKADGFNAVVLLVSWGDFQPVIDPCCRYDDRAFERLRYLIGQADAAGLKVVLRVGYGWSLNPQVGDVNERIRRLLNDSPAKHAFGQFVERLGNEVSDSPNVVLSFMSWEDQWLHAIEPSAGADYAEFLASLPAAKRPPANAPAARPDDASAPLFHAYWDWLVIHKLFAPARAHLPNLSYEARIDKEPRYGRDAAGQRSVTEWIGHPGMLEQPGQAPLTLYWAPFWGAENRGEQLSSDRSLQLLGDLLSATRGPAARRLFIDQFNFIDNTPGFESNAVLRPEDTAAFLDRAVCVLKTSGVIGYGLWTARDYRESPIYNPSFGFGLDGWRLDGPPEAARTALEALPSGDFQLRLSAGQTLTQAIGPERGRLPQPDALMDRICVEAKVAASAKLAVQAGEHAPWTELQFPATGRQQVCAEIHAEPATTGEELSLRLRSGSLALRNVQLFDHTQSGGLYDADGQPAPYLAFVQAMNRDFARPGLPSRCKPLSQ